MENVKIRTGTNCHASALAHKQVRNVLWHQFVGFVGITINSGISNSESKYAFAICSEVALQAPMQGSSLNPSSIPT